MFRLSHISPAARCQLLVELAAFAVLAAVSLHLFAWADALSLTAALLVAYAVPRVAYCSRPWATTSGRWVFAALGVGMAALAVLTVWDITLAVGHTLQEPSLHADDHRYYTWALHHYDGRCQEPEVAFPGLPLVMLWSWRLLGVSVVWPLAMNVMFTLLTVVVAAATTRRLLQGLVEQRGEWIATLALCLTATLFYFVSQGLRVQKEAMVYLSVAVMGYVLAGLNPRSPERARPAWRDATLWTAACVMLALARTTYLYFALLGLAVMAAACWRGQWRRLAVMAGVCVAAFVLGNHLASYSIDRHVSIVGGGYHMQQAFMFKGAQQPYLDLIGDYFMYPVWKRLLILPLACCVQFIIPFPWLYNDWTVLQMLPRVAWGWYAVGGMALFYFALMLSDRGNRRLGLGAWAWWPAAIYVVIAYVVAGSVSRYLLPVEPMAVPMAVLVVARLREGHWRKAFAWWTAVYAVVLAVTLVVCYHVQLSYLQALDDYYRSLA